MFAIKQRNTLKSHFTLGCMVGRIALIGVSFLLLNFTLQAADLTNQEIGSSFEYSEFEVLDTDKASSPHMETTIAFSSEDPDSDIPIAQVLIESNGFYILLNRDFNKGNVTLYTLIGVLVVNKQITTSRDYIEVPSSGMYIAKIVIDSKESIHKILIK